MYKWGFTTDGRCTHCLDEDSNMLLFNVIETGFFVYLTTIIRMAFHIDIVITEKHLLKANPETEIDLFLTIAFWCIYRYIMIRNMSGEDNRKLNLEYMFKREIYKRIEEDMNCKKKYNNFPQQLLHIL